MRVMSLWHCNLVRANMISLSAVPYRLQDPYLELPILMTATVSANCDTVHPLTIISQSDIRIDTPPAEVIGGNHCLPIRAGDTVEVISFGTTTDNWTIRTPEQGQIGGEKPDDSFMLL